MRAAADIERRLLDGSREAEQRMFAAFQASHQRGAVLVLGDDVALANAAAVDLVTAADHPLLRELALDLLAARGHRQVRLTSGLSVEVRVERIGATGGALFELAPLGETRAPVPRLRKRGGLLAGQVHRDLRAHAVARARVLVTGEQGTGRTTALRLLAADIAGADAADLPATGEQAWCARLADLAAHHPGLVAVEGVHLLPDPVAAWLCRLLDSSPAWFALTGALPLTGEQTGLAGRCAATVVLPPLRERRDELGDLVRAMIDRHLPGRGLRLTPSALDALYTQPWPGNLRELESVLRKAAATRTAGDITAADLPPGYRSGSGHRLSAWEQAERDAIVRVLEATRGNKVHAAQHLGISRSTLYSRIRALGLGRVTWTVRKPDS